MHPTLFGLALTGLLVNTALHLATFDAPTVPASLRWLAVVYPLTVTGPLVLVSLFSLIHMLRHPPAPRPPGPPPPRPIIARALWAAFRAAPPFVRVLYGLGVFLCGYILFLALQMCALLSTLKPDGYYLHYWSALVQLGAIESMV